MVAMILDGDESIKFWHCKTTIMIMTKVMNNHWKYQHFLWILINVNWLKFDNMNSLYDFDKSQWIIFENVYCSFEFLQMFID